MEGDKKKHNPYVSTNCLRFLGYNLSPSWGTPLSLQGQSKRKRNRKTLNRQIIFHFSADSCFLIGWEKTNRAPFL